jgi:hypothetical protein
MYTEKFTLGKFGMQLTDRSVLVHSVDIDAGKMQVTA